MKYALSAALLMAAMVMTLPSCSKRDREEAKKTSDGSETFKYVPRDPSRYIKKVPSEDGTDNSVKPKQDGREVNELKQDSAPDRR